MAHLLSCRLLDGACMADDLAMVSERAMACARKWEKLCEGHERRRRSPNLFLVDFCFKIIADTRNIMETFHMTKVTFLHDFCS